MKISLLFSEHIQRLTLNRIWKCVSNQDWIATVEQSRHVDAGMLVCECVDTTGYHTHTHTHGLGRFFKFLDRRSRDRSAARTMPDNGTEVRRWTDSTIISSRRWLDKQSERLVLMMIKLYLSVWIENVEKTLCWPPSPSSSFLLYVLYSLFLRMLERKNERVQEELHGQFGHFFLLHEQFNCLIVLTV